MIGLTLDIDLMHYVAYEYFLIGEKGATYIAISLFYWFICK